MTSRLDKIGPVTVSCAGTVVVAPPPQLLSNLPLLHRILEDVVGDWHRAVAPHEARLAKTTNQFGVEAAFLELQPAFLKCLFSYVLFFVSADQAYEALYAILNKANKTARVLHGKPPTATPLVKKARPVRDVAITHFPSKNAPHLDAWAGMSWQPMSLSLGPDGECNLRNITFGSFREQHRDSAGNVIAESSDIEITGIDSLHGECMRYLEQFDSVCFDFLTQLHAV